MDDPRTRVWWKALAAEAASPMMARWLLWGCVLVGIALRFIQLGTACLWFDEGYTAWAVSQPIGEVVRIIKSDTAPPLYYILLRGWTHLFGFSEAGLRSMSALMGSIALVVFAVVARRLLKSPWTAAAAVGLFSFSFMQIAYAHEARFYAMMTMLEAIDLYLVLLVCERSTPLRLISLCVAWTASLYTNNLMAVYLACLGIAWMMFPGRRPVLHRLRDAVVVTFVSAVAFAPWLPTLFAQTKRIQSGFWPVTPDAWMLERTIAVMAGVHEQSLPLLHWKWHVLLEVSFLQVNLLLLGLVLLACTSREHARRIGALLAAGVMPILIIFLYSKVRQSIFMERGFIASGVVMPLLVVMALESVRSKAARVIAIAGVVCVFSLTFASLVDRRLGEHPENWRDASAFAVQSPATHRLVICVASDGEPLFRYYACNRDYSLRADVTAAPRSFFALDPPQTMQRVRSDRDLDELRRTIEGGHFDEIVLMASHSWWGDHDLLTLNYLLDHFTEFEDRNFGMITVFRFSPETP